LEQRKILIVEDESIVRLHLKRVVESMGHVVSGLAASTEEALAAAAADVPDLALMDINLRGETDGVQTALLLRERHGVPVMFATAFADEATVQRTRTAGALGYIVKPFDSRAVQAVITTALAERDRLREMEERERALASILGNLGDAVIAVDAGLNVTFMNPRAHLLAGAASADWAGRSLLEVLRPAADDEPVLRRALEAALAGDPDPALPTITLVRADGSERLVNGTLERAGDGAAAAGLVISIRDMTDRWLRRSGPATAVAAGERGGRRMVIYSHDTFGLGHLRRSLNLAAALTAANTDLSVLLVTGSTAVHRYPMPDRVDYVKLPAVRKAAADSYQSRSVAMSDDGVRDIRANLLLRTVRDFAPDVVLVDHSPLGMRGEMVPTLEWLADHRPDCARLLGLRDIVDGPDRVIESWRRDDMYGQVMRFYDHVVVYGSARFFDPVSAYEFPDALADRVRFVDHVVEPQPDADAAAPPVPAARPLVAVTAGGGDGAVDLLADAVLGMLAGLGGAAGFHTVFLPGPFAPAGVLARLEAAAGPQLTVHRFVPSTSPFMAAADLVVCTAGYNTSVQLLQHGRRGLMVPRVLHRREQLVRAERLRDMGVVDMIHPDMLNPLTLREHIDRQLAAQVEPVAAARRAGLVRFDGAGNLARFCADLLAASPTSREATS
jgi:PAS domain S-box-containing protein